MGNARQQCSGRRDEQLGGDRRDGARGRGGSVQPCGVSSAGCCVVIFNFVFVVAFFQFCAEWSVQECAFIH